MFPKLHTSPLSSHSSPHGDVDVYVSLHDWIKMPGSPVACAHSVATSKIGLDRKEDQSDCLTNKEMFMLNKSAALAYVDLARQNSSAPGWFQDRVTMMPGFLPVSSARGILLSRFILSSKSSGAAESKLTPTPMVCYMTCSMVSILSSSTVQFG